MEAILGGVALTPVRTARHVDAEHVIGRAEMIVAGRLGSLRELAYGCGAARDIDQGQHNAELHRHLLAEPALSAHGFGRGGVTGRGRSETRVGRPERTARITLRSMRATLPHAGPP